MKAVVCCIVVFCLLGAVICSSVLSADSVDQEVEYKVYVQKFNKNYDDQEYAQRFEIYQMNTAMIAKHNSNPNSKSLFGINQFTDWTTVEFKERMLMAPMNPQSDSPCTVPNTTTDHVNEASANDLENIVINAPPASWDWRSKGAVTHVKDQGTVGTCWAFSTTGNIEGQWFLAGHDLVGLSEEQLNDCDYLDCGVFGGWPCRAYQYILQQGGLISEESYPYCVGTGACYPCMPEKFNETFCGPPPTYCNRTEWPCRATPTTDYAASIKGWKTLTSNEDQLASVLPVNGPLSVLMNAEMLQFHESGVWDPDYCDPTALDHAVLIVGYGVYDSWVWGSQPYWLVKNSWGTSWGDEGYFMIMRGQGTCGINTAVTTAVV